MNAGSENAGEGWRRKDKTQRIRRMDNNGI